MRFYRNPNILMKKLSCESSTEFMTKLKRFLADGRQDETSQLALFRFQVETLRTRIDDILQSSLTEFGNIIPNGTHIKTARVSNTVNEQLLQVVVPSFQLKLTPKKVYGLPVVPQHIYNFKDSMLVCGSKLSYVFNLELKSALPVEFGVSLAAQVYEPQRKANSHFVAVSPPNILFYYCDGIKSQVTLRQEPTALAAIVIGEVIALLGTNDGEVEAIRMQTG